MAEFAQLRIEEWEPILHELKRLDLFSLDQINEQVTHIKNQEYAIQKGTRTLDDVLNYVRYQVGILEAIQNRRHELQLFEKVPEIDETIGFRINSVFGSYERSFANDIRFWQERLNFAVKQKWLDAAFNVYQGAMNHLGSTYPILFHKASAYEWRRNPLKHIESARRILNDGLRLQKRNLDLYGWRFQLEIKHADFLKGKIEKKSKKNSRKVTEYQEEIDKSLAAAMIVYKESINFCLTRDTSVKLFDKFIQILSKYPRLEDGEPKRRILADMVDMSGFDEACFGKLGQYALEKGDFETGLSELKKGLTVHNTVKMYDIVIQTLRTFSKNRPPTMVHEEMHAIFQHGMTNDKLSAQNFLIWLDLFTFDGTTAKKMKFQNGSETLFTDEERMKVLDAAVKKYPDNLQFITEVLKMNIKNGIPYSAVVEKIQKIAPDDTANELILSILMIHSETNQSNAATVWLGKIANKTPKSTSKFLEYINLRDGIDGVRKVYKNANLIQRDVYPVMKTMADIEFKCLDHCISTNEEKFKILREIMERACQLHGKSNLDVWIDYIMYEKALKNSDKASEIYARACHVVPSNLKEELVKQRDILLTG